MTIRIAIVGLGNCASALLQGIEYYKQNPLNGIMQSYIGPYAPTEIECVIAFDVDARKVGFPVKEAIYAKPNCCYHIVDSIQCNAKVYKGPVLDGIAKHMQEYVSPDHSFVLDDTPCDVTTVQEAAKVLEDHYVDVLINYLPVGSTKATEFWAEVALLSKTAFLNCIPVFIASNPAWSSRFTKAKVPIMGDDMKSQFGASVLSQMFEELANVRGHTVQMHIQQNSGGNTDFLNMMAKERIIDKKISKENVIRNAAKTEHFIHAGPSDYIECLGDTKVAHFSLTLKGFGGAPVKLDAKLQVEDSPNSAGVVIDAVRYLKVAQDLGVFGPLYGPCAFTQKSPPIPMTLSSAQEQCIALGEGRVHDLLLDLNN